MEGSLVDNTHHVAASDSLGALLLVAAVGETTGEQLCAEVRMPLIN